MQIKIRLNLTAALLAATLLVPCAAYRAYAAPTLTAGGLLQFTNQTEFETSFPGLPNEDFEESPVGAGGYVIFPEPLNSTTNAPDAFAPGDILIGLAIQTVEGIHLTDGLAVAGSGYFSNTSKAVGINWFIDTMDISFTGSGVNAAGMDLMMDSASESVTINIYGSGGTLLDTLTPTIQTTETFFGIYSSQPITRITVASPTDQEEIVDNIQFGGTPTNLTFYTSQGAFTSAHPGLPVEDFEESPIGDTEGFPITGPIDSTSNIPGIFSPGDILDGLRINGLTGTIMGIIGGNYLTFGNTTKVVFENNLLDGLRIDFTNNDTYAVGMDLMRAFSVGNVTIAVYGPHSIFLGTTTNTIQLSETFVGVFSNQPITRIEVLNAADVDMVDNIRFGGSPAGLTFYTNRTSFDSATPGLKNEDFSESTVAVPTACDEPLDSTTNNSCFSLGNIVSGVSFSTVAGTNCPACMYVYPVNFICGNVPAVTIGAHDGADSLKIDFAGKVNYAGLHVYNSAFYVDIYGLSNELLGSAYIPAYQCAGGFWGVKSDKPISRLVLDTNPIVIFLDYILFGSKFPWAMFLPAINGAPATP